MGMSTLPVKPRDRVRRRAQAADGGKARPKAPVSGGDFPKPDKQLGSRRRHYGLGEGEDPRSTRLTDLRCGAPPSARSPRRALPESHTRRISAWTGSTSPNSTALGADSSWRGTRSPWVSTGGMGYVDHLVRRHDGIAESRGTRTESGAGQDRRRPQALRRLLSTRLPLLSCAALRR